MSSPEADLSVTIAITDNITPLLIVVVLLFFTIYSVTLNILANISEESFELINQIRAFSEMEVDSVSPIITATFS